MCTRAVYQGPDATIITVCSRDWMSDLGSNLWIFPRGMARVGAVQPGALTWTSKYGSVIASAFEAATADGMNEKGWSPICCTSPNRTTATLWRRP